VPEVYMDFCADVTVWVRRFTVFDITLFDSLI